MTHAADKARRALPESCPIAAVAPATAPAATASVAGPARPARSAGLAAARRRDRRVYLAAHLVLFTLLAASRRRPVLRIGRTVLVHDAGALRHALTRLPLDRAAAGTTGGVARSALDARDGDAPGGGVLFDQQGAAHRAARRALADGLSAAGVARLRPLWQDTLARGLAPLAEGRAVDLVAVVRETAGVTACALLGVDADPVRLADAAADAATAAVREHLPALPRPWARYRPGAVDAARRLRDVLHEPGRAPAADAAARAMLAVASVTTVVAALPRAAAWCADAGWWDEAADDTLRPALARELLRVTAPSPLLPRVAAGPGTLGGRPVRAGDRLLLVARHAVRAHTDDPDCRHPAEPALSRLVFGAGPHACPGARLATVQLEDFLHALAPHRPVVVRARADRRAALPGWRSLVVAPGGHPARETA
ncbi:cytochrome P450 [Streptomyces sp. UNOB3_S3]|uniref:cytochrome P450 n=1 Tax=Streptomyces sp. UNOB3_S3 TaxID=2871682 RepID=UPI001E5C658A|nr:cytochrome P450 [Streptomyces sp. UNOB3_S3]MCC3776420.1 cytochrome P450 [Streptomyces sp. UNOB3_S3]